MEEQLQRTPFFAGDAMSVADIALYAYTHEAGKGGFDLAAYPAVSAWLGRVEADPGHVPMSWLPSVASDDQCDNTSGSIPPSAGWQTDRKHPKRSKRPAAIS